ncbi:oligopeptide transporter [Blastomyces gilchristii SLH14081]|uniref:Oligopeptide transporter n=1 Tax=Blastomyces gilchristii (strain SLH14081) TaxID=559298 RepID=A0A179V0H0_BLAGS|nr:oligopeptide transporter [Blastomyces gilchristii SLH14081]OAT13580.1 oligopeptide transporter [Blastomyces gilchristii SLH14081]
MQKKSSLGLLEGLKGLVLAAVFEASFSFYEKMIEIAAMDRSFTVRALLSGLLIGVLVNLSNTYYGLRIGVASQMSMVSGLLGFVVFKLFSRCIESPLTPAENVLIISVATATGCMPVTAGFVGIIPALEYLIGPEENGPLRIAWESLVFWSIGLCFFGLIFASIFREHFVVRETLPWPGAKATAHLINTIHHVPPEFSTAPGGILSPSLTEENPRAGQSGTPVEERLLLLAHGSGGRWKVGMNRLFQGATGSGIFTIVIYFVPILKKLPILGSHAASEWLWSMDLSPGFLGQGIITGPIIPLHMFIGAIIGWGILSPYAKHQGWAPGDVDDWETGSRGWIIWVSLAALFADASVKLSWFIVRPFWNKNDSVTYPRPPRGRYQTVPTHDDFETPQFCDSQVVDRSSNRWSPLKGERVHLSDSPITSRALGLGFLVSVVICILAINFTFGNFITWYHTILAIALSLPMAVIGIRSLAETDYNPESALVSQLVFATLIPHSNANGIIISLLSAALAQAGANQAGDISFDFKIGSLVGAHPRAQTYGQIIGSLFGALISCGIYKLYASQYPIPGPLFRVPSSYLVLSTARLVMGQGLPEGVAPFALGAAILSMLITIVKMRYETRWWQKLIPSGVSLAIGIYNVPSFTITRVIGGLTFWLRKVRSGESEGDMIFLASGLVLGESISSLVTLALTAAHVKSM